MSRHYTIDRGNFSGVTVSSNSDGGAKLEKGYYRALVYIESNTKEAEEFISSLREIPISSVPLSGDKITILPKDTDSSSSRILINDLVVSNMESYTFNDYVDGKITSSNITRINTDTGASPYTVETIDLRNNTLTEPRVFYLHRNFFVRIPNDIVSIPSLYVSKSQTEATFYSNTGLQESNREYPKVDANSVHYQTSGIKYNRTPGFQDNSIESNNSTKKLVKGTISYYGTTIDRGTTVSVSDPITPLYYYDNTSDLETLFDCNGKGYKFYKVNGEEITNPSSFVFKGLGTESFVIGNESVGYDVKSVNVDDVFPKTFVAEYNESTDSIKMYLGCPSTLKTGGKVSTNVGYNSSSEHEDRTDVDWDFYDYSIFDTVATNRTIPITMTETSRAGRSFTLGTTIRKNGSTNPLGLTVVDKMTSLSVTSPSTLVGYTFEDFPLDGISVTATFNEGNERDIAPTTRSVDNDASISKKFGFKPFGSTSDVVLYDRDSLPLRLSEGEYQIRTQCSYEGITLDADSTNTFKVFSYKSFARVTPSSSPLVFIRATNGKEYIPSHISVASVYKDGNGTVKSEKSRSFNDGYTFWEPCSDGYLSLSERNLNGINIPIIVTAEDRTDTVDFPVIVTDVAYIEPKLTSVDKTFYTGMERTLNGNSADISCDYYNPTDDLEVKVCYAPWDDGDSTPFDSTISTYVIDDFDTSNGGIPCTKPGTYNVSVSWVSPLTGDVFDEETYETYQVVETILESISVSVGRKLLFKNTSTSVDYLKYILSTTATTVYNDSRRSGSEGNLLDYSETEVDFDTSKVGTSKVSVTFGGVTGYSEDITIVDKTPIYVSLDIVSGVEIWETEDIDQDFYRSLIDNITVDFDNGVTYEFPAGINEHTDDSTLVFSGLPAPINGRIPEGDYNISVTYTYDRDVPTGSDEDSKVSLTATSVGTVKVKKIYFNGLLVDNEPTNLDVYPTDSNDWMPNREMSVWAQYSDGSVVEIPPKTSTTNGYTVNYSNGISKESVGSWPYIVYFSYVDKDIDASLEVATVTVHAPVDFEISGVPETVYVNEFTDDEYWSVFNKSVSSIRVKAIYDNDTFEQVEVSTSTVFATNWIDTGDDGIKTVQVYSVWRSTTSESIDVTAVRREITDLVINADIKDKVCYLGGSFDPSGIKLDVECTDPSCNKTGVTSSMFTTNASSIDTSTAGNKTLSITYTDRTYGISRTEEITVEVLAPTEIKVFNNGDAISGVYVDNFEDSTIKSDMSYIVSNLFLEAYYSYNLVERVDNLTIGNQITISLRGTGDERRAFVTAEWRGVVNDSISVPIILRKPTSIKVNSIQPTSCYAGNYYTPSSVSLDILYNDPNKVVKTTSVTDCSFDADTSPDTTYKSRKSQLTITYTPFGLSATTSITVLTPTSVELHGVVSEVFVKDFGKEEYESAIASHTEGVYFVASYSDGSTETVSNSTTVFNNVDVSSLSGAGDFERTATVTVSWRGVTSSGVSVSVKKIVKTSLSVKTLPTNRTCRIYDTYVPSGMVVIATYNDGHEETESNSNYACYVDTNSSGSKPLIVSSYEDNVKTAVKESVIDVQSPILILSGVVNSVFVDDFDKDYESSIASHTSSVKIETRYTDSSLNETLVGSEAAPYIGVSKDSWSDELVRTASVYCSYRGLRVSKSVSVVKRRPVSISVGTNPTSTTCWVGDTYSPSGLKINVTWNDTSRNQTNVATGFTCSTIDTSTAGTKTLTITYQGNLTTTLSIEVKTPTVTGITLTSGPSNTKCRYNESSYTPQDIVLDVSYSNGKTVKDVTSGYTYEFNNKTGDLTITYGGQSTSTSITILSPTLSLSGVPSVVHLDSFDGDYSSVIASAVSNVTLTATYSDSSFNETLTGSDAQPHLDIPNPTGDSDTKETTVTAIYRGQSSSSYTVRLERRRITSFAIITGPTNKSCYVGDKYEAQGVTYSVAYSDPSIKSTGSLSYSKLDTSSAGNKQLAITYSDKYGSATHWVTITVPTLSSVSVSPSSDTMEVGKTYTITASMGTLTANYSGGYPSRTVTPDSVSPSGEVTASTTYPKSIEFTYSEGNISKSATISISRFSYVIEYEWDRYNVEKEKGSLVGTVTSKRADAYPDNGVSGSRWYEYVGAEEDDYGVARYKWVTYTVNYTKGSWSGTATSKYDDTYPENGIDGDYWYVYWSSSKTDEKIWY